MRRSLAQQVEHLPGARAEQADDDLAVGERGVVVGNLAQARRGAGCFCFGGDPVDRQRGVHGGRAQSRGRCERSEASYRSAAYRPPARRRPASRRVYPACRRARPAREKRGCHLGPATIAPSPRPPTPSHGVVMKLKSLVSCSLVACRRLLGAGAGAGRDPVVAFDGRRARRVGQRPGQGLQREPEGLQGRADLQGQLRRVDDGGDRRLPRRQRAAHPAGVRGRHRDDDGQQGRHRAGRQGDDRTPARSSTRRSTCPRSPATTRRRTARC